MNKINTLALTLLITGSIDSIRNLPAAALCGSPLIFFFIFAAVVFLIPTALVSAELASSIKEGGIYQWVRLAFGERMGFLAVWLQWVNNIIWFPTMLSFIGGTATFIINPDLAQNKYYMISMVLAIFWALTLANLKGIRLSARFASFCAVVGLFIPMGLLILFAIIWLASGHTLQIPLHASAMMPNWTQLDSWVGLTAITLSFMGMELATVHINDVNNPQKTFPRALGLSTITILITMMLGSLAIAFTLPNQKINLVNGTIQAFSFFLDTYHMSWLTPVLTVLLVIGSVGGVISWIVSPVKGIAQAAGHGFLPAVFAKENKYGVPQNLLITQAVLVSLVCLVFLLLPSVNASYWLLSALSTQLYILMYVLMFFAAIKLRKKSALNTNTFKIPGKNAGLYTICTLGLIGCAIALFVGFIPPSNINIGSKLNYLIIFCSGMVGMVLPVTVFYLYHARKQKAVMADAVLAND